VGQERLGPSYFFISLVLGPHKQPRMVGSTLGVYSFGLIFVSVRKNKRHLNIIIIIISVARRALACLIGGHSGVPVVFLFLRARINRRQSGTCNSHVVPSNMHVIRQCVFHFLYVDICNMHVHMKTCMSCSYVNTCEHIYVDM
jgi:hypothetical protein